MEQVRSNGEQKELRDEIVDLGTRYGIVTPYTSYLALEDKQEVSRHFMNVAPAARGRAATGGGLSTSVYNEPASAPKQVVTVTGADAIQQSKTSREQQNYLVLKDNIRLDAVRRVEGRTFYLIDGVWTDSEFKPDAHLPETVLVFGSDEYFTLLKQNPKLGSYFALGERVLVVFEGRVYRVTSK
jgi:Ca-activated chloride channel family protein